VSRPSFGELGGQDPYDILELPSGAADDDVRAARRRLLRRYHPDLPSGDLRRTQLITAAADLLLDPLRRIGYYDLRDEESRRVVFMRARADVGRPATRPGERPATRPGASAAPGQPIRPTFVTPPTRSPTGPGPATEGDRPAAAPQGYRPVKSGYATAAFGRGHEPAADARADAPTAAGADRATGPQRAPLRADSGYDPTPAAASRWNALAVASVVAILTWTPIPLVLGLLALRQIRRFGQRGTRLALTGVIAGAILVLVYLYVLVISGL
jgi:hypothetical protein